METELRILHIVHSLNIGGLERVVVDIGKAFKASGCSVGICCLDSDLPLGKDAIKSGIKVYALLKKPGLSPMIPFQIGRIIKGEKYNVIHTHNEAGLIYGVAGALLASVKNVVHTEHGKEPSYDQNKKIKFAERIFFRKVKQVVTVSHQLKSKVAKSAKIDEQKITVIRNGIDVQKFYRPACREATRQKLGLAHDDFVIGNIARMVPLKNQRFLIFLFQQLVSQFPKLRLILAGDGPLREELEAYCRQHLPSRSVLFLGERRDIPELLSAFDMFILPSLTEGISITLIEAMAAGAFIVASAVGGNPEIIHHGKNGLLIPLGKSTTWISAIKSCIEDDKRRKELAATARITATGRFSLDKVKDRYTIVYNTERK